MARAAGIAIILMASYLVDFFALDGRFYSETKIVANNLAFDFNYKVQEFLRPIGR